MPNTFGSINETREAQTPQFQQKQAVASTTADTVAQVGSLAGGLFQQASQYSEGKQEAAGTSAIGDLQNQMLRIKQAGATNSGINVVEQQRLVASNFARQHPELATQGFKAVEDVTGFNPAGLSPVEKAEFDMTNKAIADGYGYFGANPEFQAMQTEMWVSQNRKDAEATSEITQSNLALKRGEISEKVAKDKMYS